MLRCLNSSRVHQSVTALPGFAQPAHTLAFSSSVTSLPASDTNQADSALANSKKSAVAH